MSTGYNERIFTGLAEFVKENGDGSIVLQCESEGKKETGETILVLSELLKKLAIRGYQLGDTFYYEAVPLRNEGKENCHLKALRIAPTTIGTGTVTSLQPGSALLKTDRGEDVFAPGSAVYGLGTVTTLDLTKLLRVGDQMHFIVWNQRLIDSLLAPPIAKGGGKVGFKAQRLSFPVMQDPNGQQFGVVVSDYSQTIVYSRPTGRLTVSTDTCAVRNPPKLQFGDRIAFNSRAYNSGRRVFGCRFEAINWRLLPNRLFTLAASGKGGFSRAPTSPKLPLAAARQPIPSPEDSEDEDEEEDDEEVPRRGPKVYTNITIPMDSDEDDEVARINRESPAASKKSPTTTIGSLSATTSSRMVLISPTSLPSFAHLKHGAVPSSVPEKPIRYPAAVPPSVPQQQPSWEDYSVLGAQAQAIPEVPAQSLGLDKETQTEVPLMEVQIVNRIVENKEIMSVLCQKYPNLIQQLLVRR